jgi:hypothetical protein
MTDLETYLFIFQILTLLFVLYELVLVKKTLKRMKIVLAGYMSAFEYIAEVNDKLMEKEKKEEGEKKSGNTFIG